MKTVMGYRRAAGRFGIRNNVMVISLVECANGAVDKIAHACHVPYITIDTGCGEYKDQENRTNLGLIRAGQHPNTYGVLLVSLGCQWTKPDYIAAEIEKTGTKVFHLCIQDECGVMNTVEKGIKIVEEMKAEAAAMKREEFPISDLVVSVYCGGSDWSSSLAANGTTGEAVDLLADDGGAFVSCGVRGMPGNESHLINLAATQEVGLKILNIVDEYRHDVFKMTGQSIADVNPTPGNKAHGMTTLCEKAISNLKLTGSRTKVQGVLEVGEEIPGPGQWFLDNRQGGNDVYAATALAMTGAHICLFTTGRGTPDGNAASVVLKITGNPDTWKRMGEEMMDFNASKVITEGMSISDCGKELYQLLLEVANGKQTKAEALEDYSWATPPFGKI
ncbi:MAG: UxaA family hydrolase [Clostridiales bacterium]|nr:UxaA family hydrolase [Clostridiales bacterium]